MMHPEKDVQRWNLLLIAFDISTSYGFGTLSAKSEAFPSEKKQNDNKR
jgi:hypothetical protein